MSVSPAVRVGIIVFVALVALAAVAWFLTGYRIRAAGYPVTAVFSDALGLTTGSEVRMAGVTIGYVDDITLDRHQRAVVRMAVNRRYLIPRGSIFTLRVGMLIGEKYIDIIPNRKGKGFLSAGAKVKGDVPPRIEDILPDAKQLVANLKDASENLKDILSDEEFEVRIKNSLANIEMATIRMNQTMATIQGTVVGEQDKIRMMVSNAAVTSENLRELTGELERFVKDGNIQNSIRETLATAQHTADNLDRTTASLEKLVTNPEFQDNIRQTAAEARKAVEESREVINRIGRVFGLGHGMKAGIRTSGLDVESLFNPEDNRFRATITTTVPLKNGKFLDLGIYDIGAGNKLVFQPGIPIGPKTDFRYGIYASSPGLGLDQALSSRAYGRLDLYDSYDPRLDFRLGYDVTDDWGLLFGVDRVFDDNQFTLGMRLRK